MSTDWTTSSRPASAASTASPPTVACPTSCIRCSAARRCSSNRRRTSGRWLSTSSAWTSASTSSSRAICGSVLPDIRTRRWNSGSRSRPMASTIACWNGSRPRSPMRTSVPSMSQSSSFTDGTRRRRLRRSPSRAGARACAGARTPLRRGPRTRERRARRCGPRPTGGGSGRRRSARRRRRANHATAAASSPAAHSSLGHWRDDRSVAAGTSPVAPWRINASRPVTPSTVIAAMWPSPRNSRSKVCACHSTISGSSGHGSDAWAANSGRPSGHCVEASAARRARTAASSTSGDDARSPRRARRARSAAACRASRIASGEATDHAAGMVSRTNAGKKLKNVAITTSAGTGPMAAARDAKYPPIAGGRPMPTYASPASGAK